MSFVDYLTDVNGFTHYIKKPCTTNVQGFLLIIMSCGAAGGSTRAQWLICLCVEPR